jgi:hypothetical protein
MKKITISLNEIRIHRPCLSGWKKALHALGKTEADDEQIPVSRFLETNGLNDTLWVLRCLPDYANLWRLFAVWCAKQVEHLMPDERSKNALKVAERYAIGQANQADINAACAAACAATPATTGHAAWDAARAAESAATKPVGLDATRHAACAAAESAATTHAAWDAARLAKLSATRAAQIETLRRLLDTATIEIDGWEYYVLEEKGRQ